MLKVLSTCLFIGSVASLVRAASSPPPVYRPLSATGVEQFHSEIQPLLKKYCYDCHADGAKMGNVSFDTLDSDPALLASHTLFGKVLKNVRSGTMPPQDEPQPSAQEKELIARWIKAQVYRSNPANPDPGRVTMRRLNRVEYRNTIRDLIGVDYDTISQFPPDDAGHGFDNIGDVLTISPMLLEKYLDAAQSIVSQAVPTTSKVVAESEIKGGEFKSEGEEAKPNASEFRFLSYSQPATVSHAVNIEHGGKYQLVFDLVARESYVDNKFDYNKCRLTIKSDGQELLRQEYNREGNKPLRYIFDVVWPAGEHEITFELEPLTPGVEQIRSLGIQINKLTLRGPYDDKYKVEPANYRRFFPRPVPASASSRRAYARELLAKFSRQAFRRPVDAKVLGRLVGVAESVYTQPGQTFEAGVAQAMVAILASPRFLFREEGTIATPQKAEFALVDEHALASRLSYFLWSSMPDDELFRLAARGQLRKNLRAQVKRMLGDERSQALTSNFSGQWLQTRDIEKVPINARAVLAREVDPATTPAAGMGQRRGRPAFDLDEPLRKALHRETDLYFDHIVREDRSVLELINSDYTFVNARLAQFYGLGSLGVAGDGFRKVTLPEGSPRGGVLTMGSVLAVTSNPTRTSPVKRGLFVLDNILGAPAPPAPPNIPSLEDAETKITDRKPTSREALAAHRGKPECASCHSRMDPPGLALENFNALGQWREKEYGQPIETDGKLITGETFKDIRDLKRILVEKHSTDFYRCLTEKLLTYSLGRGLDYYDVESVDHIVADLESDKGKFSTLLLGVIESAPFQKSRVVMPVAEPATLQSAKSRSAKRLTQARKSQKRPRNRSTQTRRKAKP
ncbi:MAG TPA: DUF1592 domain-containing protein [Abditibacterium sp.]